MLSSVLLGERDGVVQAAAAQFLLHGCDDAPAARLHLHAQIVRDDNGRRACGEHFHERNLQRADRRFLIGILMGVVGLFAVGGVGITGDDEADIAEQAQDGEIAVFADAR